MTLDTIPFQTTTGESTSLAAYHGQVKLIVNVASRCGLAPQYEQLEQLQRTYGDRGFTVLGFPSNQFLQELSTNEAIAEYCSTTWGITFPIFELTSRSSHRTSPTPQFRLHFDRPEQRPRALAVQLHAHGSHVTPPNQPESERRDPDDPSEKTTAAAPR